MLLPCGFRRCLLRALCGPLSRLLGTRLGRPHRLPPLLCGGDDCLPASRREFPLRLGSGCRVWRFSCLLGSCPSLALASPNAFPGSSTHLSAFCVSPVLARQQVRWGASQPGSQFGNPCIQLLFLASIPKIAAFTISVVNFGARHVLDLPRFFHRTGDAEIHTTTHRDIRC